MPVDMIWSRQWPIQFWLRLMAFGGFLPAIVMAIILIAHSYEHDRSVIEMSTISTARALMQAVDRDLNGVTAALQILASSASLHSADFDAFKAQSLELTQTQIFTAVILADLTGKQLTNTLVPSGKQLPRNSDLNLIGRVITTGQPVISDLHLGTVTHRLLISVVVPVLSDGKPIYALTGAVYTDGLRKVLARQHLPPGWVTAICDSSDTIAARSDQNDRLIGQKVLPDLRQQMAMVKEGVLEERNRDGVPTFVTFTRSDLSGWSVVIGIPAADLTADLRRSLWESIAVAAVLLVSALFMAQKIGKRLCQSIETLKSSALALATDQPLVPLNPTSITEVSEVGEALVRTSRLLQQRAAEREAAYAEAAATAGRLAERSADLERSNTDLEQFAYIASHDLKAPLRGIGHLVEWIVKDIAATASPETADHLLLLSGRVRRMETLLDGLLAYARIGHGHMTLETVDTGALVGEITTNLSPPTGFVVTCVEPMPQIRTRRIPLERVLQNLIDNAIKHHDRATGLITVAARLQNDLAEFRVTDDGPGILPRYHNRIFQIFQTLQARDEVEGSGIGLAIVKRKIELHGGQIHVESAPPARGSSFVFTWKNERETIDANG